MNGVAPLKRAVRARIAVVAAALALAGAGREAGGGGRAAPTSARSGGTVHRMRRVSLPRPTTPARAVRAQPRIAYPSRDGDGARISQPAARTPPAHHASVMRSASFAAGIRGQQRSEMKPNHFYWHKDGGLRYSHYYDGRNHWYGFYHGPTFYWTQYYGNRWWWYDAGLARWDFWDNGFWWWAGPGGAYVYMDNAYYPYEDTGVTVETQETLSPPAKIPAPDAGATTSPDNRRLVQVFGSDFQAFLYDKTTTPPKFLAYLGQGVSKVRYSGATAGAPLQILIEFKDDTFALFDADGVSQSKAIQSAETKNSAPAQPESVPPPPTTGPGG